MVWVIVMIREESSILGSKSKVMVFHYSSSEIHSDSDGEGGGVIRVNLVNLVIFIRK